MKKKIIVSVLISMMILISALAYLLYTSFHGDPFIEFTLEEWRFKKYLEKRFCNHDKLMGIKQVHYSFKKGSYAANYRLKGYPNTDFIVFYSKSKIADNFIENTVKAYFNKGFQQETQKLGINNAMNSDYTISFNLGASDYDKRCIDDNYSPKNVDIMNLRIRYNLCSEEEEELSKKDYLAIWDYFDHIYNANQGLKY